MKPKSVILTLLASAAVLFAGTSSAAIMISTKVDNKDTDNVLLEKCPDGTLSGPGTLVQGCLNQDSSTIVNFLGDELLTIQGGQSSIVAVDGGFSFLNISLKDPNTTFSKLILNIDSVSNGFVEFFGLPGGSSGIFNLKGNGQNFFTITGEDFRSISFNTTADVVTSLTQVRLGGVEQIDRPPQGEVPEPATLALIGLGLLGLAASRRRRG